MEIIKIRINEKKEIKIPDFHKGYSLDFLGDTDGLIIEYFNEGVLIELSEVHTNTKILKYEIKDLDDNFIDDGELKLEIIPDEENKKLKEKGNKKQIIEYPKKLELKKGDSESVLLTGISEFSKIVWSSEDIDNFKEVISIKNNGILISINTVSLEPSVYAIDFEVDGKEKYTIRMRVIANNLLNKNYNKNDNLKEKSISNISTLMNKEFVKNQILENTSEKKKKVLKPMPRNLILEVLKNNRVLSNLSTILTYSESVLIGKRSASAKPVDIDLKDVLDVADKCSRNQLKIFRDNDNVIIKNIGNHRILIKNKNIEVFPNENIYLELNDEIIIGNSVKIVLIENN